MTNNFWKILPDHGTYQKIRNSGKNDQILEEPGKIDQLLLYDINIGCGKIYHAMESSYCMILILAVEKYTMPWKDNASLSIPNRSLTTERFIIYLCLLCCYSV